MNARILIFWAIAVLFYAYEFMLKIAPSVMIPELMAHYHADATELAFISSAFLFSYAFAQIPAGLVLDKFGPNRVLPAAMAALSLSTIALAFTHALPTALLLRFISGFASAFAFIGALKVASRGISDRYFPLLVGLTNVAGVLGGFLVTHYLVRWVQYVGYQTLTEVLGYIGLSLTFIMMFVSQNIRVHQAEFKSFRIAAVLPIGLYAALMVMPIAGFWEMWCIPYIQLIYDVPRSAAADAITIILLGIALGGPILGYIQSQYAFKFTFRLASAVCAALMFFAITAPPVHYFAFLCLLFVYGFMSSHMLLCFAIRPAVEGHATAIAVINMMITIIAACTQPLLGYGFTRVVVNVGLDELTIGDYRQILIILPAGLALAHIISWLTKGLRYATTSGQT